MTANWTDFVSGAVLTASQLNGVLDDFSDVAIFTEEQASGTNAGTFTSGSYAKRTLNTTVVNNIASCTLTSSVISLPAGTYQVRANSQGLLCGLHKARLQNTTAATTLAIGTTVFASNTSDGWAVSDIYTVFTLSVTSDIELQSRCATTQATNGLGSAANFGDVEVYRQIMIRRIA